MRVIRTQKNYQQWWI
uniref:Truncated envelope glycoprotein n=1 Tax=Human immunodeficiency virus type 1 TaxID=11676 RepID=A0A0H3YA55_HV1|nr:truncated envelope glycoprotein [Human immunodeficiency virus 1]